MQPASLSAPRYRDSGPQCPYPGKRIFIELMTSDRKLKASREGSK